MTMINLLRKSVQSHSCSYSQTSRKKRSAFGFVFFLKMTQNWVTRRGVVGLAWVWGEYNQNILYGTQMSQRTKFLKRKKRSIKKTDEASK